MADGLPAELVQDKTNQEAGDGKARDQQRISGSRMAARDGTVNGWIRPA
jgi:hypothetical protein